MYLVVNIHSCDFVDLQAIDCEYNITLKLEIHLTINNKHNVSSPKYMFCKYDFVLTIYEEKK